MVFIRILQNELFNVYYLVDFILSKKEIFAIFIQSLGKLCNKKKLFLHICV